MSELAVTLPEPQIAVTEPSRPLLLRDEVLAGAFFGHRHPESAARIAEFPYMPTAEALAA